jgi:hypothetical protein
LSIPPRFIEVANGNPSAEHIGNAAKPDPERLESQSIIVSAIVQAVVMVPVKGKPDLHRLRQIGDRLEAMRVAIRRLMRYQYIRRLAVETKPVLIEDRRQMLAVFLKKTLPAQSIGALADALSQVLGIALIDGFLESRFPREPDFATKNAAQPGNAQAIDLDNATVQIARLE